MLKILTPEEMARADRAAISSGIASFDLMRAAGRAVAEAACELMGGTYGRRVLVLAGRGNNGGDGSTAAAFLARRGAVARVLLSDDPARLEGDALRALDLHLGLCGPAAVGRATGESVQAELDRSDLVIDALVGTGFRGALRGPAAEAAEAVNRWDGNVLSVDIPSGVDATTGRIEGTAVRASATLTLAALKPGLVLNPGAGYAGKVDIADIGIGQEHMVGSMRLAESADVAQVLPERGPEDHKRSVGKVLIVGGSRGMSGAAVLAATAALRTGAGLVWAAVPRSIASLVEQSVTEAVVEALPETETGSIARSALDRVLELAEGADSVALGPGMTIQPLTRQFILDAGEAIGRPLVIDADGINAFAGSSGRPAAHNAATILTPHSGELARLLDSDVKQIRAEPIDSVRRAAEITGATVLLKGKPTLVALPGGVVAVDTGGAFLASAGTGDVLTGVIAALAAKRPLEAAWAGAWVHGMAARFAAGALQAAGSGVLDRGVLASDVARSLPFAVAAVRSGVLGQ